MATEIKCPSCGTWNLDKDYCSQCNTLLSPVLIEEKREEQREEQRKNKPLPPVEIFLNKWKNHRFLLLRILYKIVYTIWVIFMTIAGLFAYLAASPNG